MILYIGLREDKNIYIKGPSKWYAAYNSEYRILFNRDWYNLMTERNDVISQYLGTTSWAIIDYGNYDYFIAQGQDVYIDKEFE